MVEMAAKLPMFGITETQYVRKAGMELDSSLAYM